jgi:acylglycerol lipase
MDGLGVPDKSFKAYEGGYHKLHVEPDGIKEALVKDVAEWVLARCSSPGTNDGENQERSKAKL